MRKQAEALEIQGHDVELTHLDKVYYPQTGFRKADVLDYYIRVAPAVLPHLKDRALVLKRYPEGVEGGHFYQKECPEHHPDWLATIDVEHEHGKGLTHHCAANNLESLVWLANTGNLELHALLWRRQKPDKPDHAVFDLDPGPGRGLVDCARVAVQLRDLLSELGLVSVAKTSGSKGIQVYLPLGARTEFRDVRAFTQAVSQLIEKREPSLVTATMAKAERTGRIYIDWAQNMKHKSTVLVYSLRAKERPMVSTPVTWCELERATSPEDLQFTSRQVLERVHKHGDLFAASVEAKQKLPVLA